MGVKSSPYQAVQGMAVVEEVIRGNPEDSSNVFCWSDVRLNCPGDATYNPFKPWVSKFRKRANPCDEAEEEVLAADLVGYVDDFRTTGPSREEAWLAARQTASI